MSSNIVKFHEIRLAAREIGQTQESNNPVTKNYGALDKKGRGQLSSF